eukprot:672117-Rhodomonas_salina.1
MVARLTSCASVRPGMFLAWQNSEGPTTISLGIQSVKVRSPSCSECSSGTSGVFLSPQAAGTKILGMTFWMR